MNISSENPTNWQTNYSASQAYRDLGKNRLGFILPVFLIILVPLSYFISNLALFSVFTTYPAALKILFVSVMILLFFVLFSVLPAYFFALRFLIEFYRPPIGIDLHKIVKFRLFGKSSLFSLLNIFSKIESMTVKAGEIEEKDNWVVWTARNIGGPIRLVVFDGNALYLESANRFSRVIGSDELAPILNWYETIKYVVDLRPQVTGGRFNSWTKDGINIILTAQIECQIGNPHQGDLVNNLVYPYDPLAVKKAVERTSVRWPNRQEGFPSEFTWLDAAWGQVTGIVPNYIGSRFLDDLIMADRKSGQILSRAVIKEILSVLNAATSSFGVFVSDFQILKVDLPEEIVQSQKDYWKAEGQSISTIREGQTKAFNIRAQSKAQADTQRDLIMAIADGLRDSQEIQFNETLLLSLTGILDESMEDPLLRAYTAKEALDVLEKIRTLLDED